MSVGLVYPINLVVASYVISVMLWRWLTYEARTIETYIPLAGLAAVPGVVLVPLYTRGVALGLYPFICVFLVTVDLVVVFVTWRHFVAGKMFRFVDMHGKVCIVTGANTGIGRETARYLAQMGAHVILACRTETRARDAINYILQTTPNVAPSQLDFMALDVSSMQSVQDFVKSFQQRGFGGLHVLINNAGVMLQDRCLTSDGLEATMATNHYGHFLLTTLLLPELEKVEDARVLNVSSSLHKVASSFNFEDPDFHTGYTLFGAYAQSKLANLIFTVELQRRLDEKHIPIAVNAIHPGNVQTEVTRNMPLLLRWGQKLCKPLFMLYQKNARAGAYTTVHVATSPHLQGTGGKYFVNCEATGDVNRVAYDRDVGKKLWELSERKCRGPKLTSSSGMNNKKASPP